MSDDKSKREIAYINGLRVAVITRPDGTVLYSVIGR